MLSFLLPLFWASTILATPLAEREAVGYHTILNKCPKPINLFHNSFTENVTIPSGGNLVVPQNNFWGSFHTDANAGWETSPGKVFLNIYPSGLGLYYMTVGNAVRANVGLQVRPLGNFTTNTGGFCETIRCDGGSSPCPQTFSEMPRNTPVFSRQKVPTPPYFQCPFPSVDFEITFCPTGRFPDKPGKPIRFNHLPNKCLDVKGGVFANGTPVGIYDCNGTPAQDWVVEYEFSNGRAVRVAGTDFCLDAGPNLANGVELKIWQCYDDLIAQRWYPRYEDDHIELAYQGFCIDLEEGNTTNGHKVQTWECADKNENQIWIQEHMNF